jgi:hypothetical protein
MNKLYTMFIVGFMLLIPSASVHAVGISTQCANYATYTSNGQIIDSNYWGCADGIGDNGTYTFHHVYIPEKTQSGSIKLQSGDVFQASYLVGNFTVRPILQDFTYQSMLTTPLVYGSVIATDTAGENGDPYVLTISKADYDKYLSGQYKGFEVVGTGTYYNSHNLPTVDWSKGLIEAQAGVISAGGGLLQSMVSVVISIIPIAIAIVGGLVVTLFGLRWLIGNVRKMMGK